MSSPPPPIDHGDDSPGREIEPVESSRGESSHGATFHGATTRRRDRQPNYLVRRAIAIGAVVAVLAAGSVVVGRIIGAGDNDDGKSPVSAEWNTVVVVADEEVRLVDPSSGDVTATFPGEEPLLDDESLATGHTLVLMNDFGRITELDLRDGTIRRSSAPEGSALYSSSENPSLVLAGPPIGGDVALVDTRTGSAFDIGIAAGLSDPLMFVNQVLVNRSGSHVATADARSFQSVLVDVETRTPVLLAGQVVALDDDTVITAQRAGDEAELEFYDLQGERRGSVDAPSPQVTMLTGETSALIVSADGAIASVSAGGDVDELGVIGGAVAGESAPAEVSGGVAASESTRLLIATADEVVLLNKDGVVLARAPGELLSPVGRVSSCVLIGSTRPNGTAVQLDLVTGDVLGEVTGGIVGSASADGCTISIIADTPRIVAGGVELDLGATTRGSVTIAPDASAYVVSTSTGERLISLDGEADEPVDPIVIADGSVLVRFAEV